jgi:hypothetical protein
MAQVVAHWPSKCVAEFKPQRHTHVKKQNKTRWREAHMVVHACLQPELREAEIEGSQSNASPGQKHKPQYEKIKLKQQAQDLTICTESC